MIYTTTGEWVFLFLSACILTVVFEGLLLPVLRRRHAGQPILEIGPAWHMSKSGTPTMGGLAFIAAVAAALFLYAIWLFTQGRQSELQKPALLLLYAIGGGAIGFFDDFKKLAKKENKGLSAPQKYLLQLLLSGVFLFFAVRLGFADTMLYLPFAKRTVTLGFFYYPLVLLFLTGMMNALNLTDGLDGLLASTVAVFAGFSVLYALARGNGLFLTAGVLLLGASIGFLFYNAHPAKVFMGDTGSLFFGAFVAGLGILSARELTVLTAGGVYLIEAASVILQVVFFKCTGGRRLFLMAPLHHHFEKRGLSENKVVALFAAAAVLFAVLAFFGG